MGRLRTLNTELPKGMRARVRKNVRVNEDRVDVTYYTYDLGGSPRKEVKLVNNNLEASIALMEASIRKMTPEEKTRLLSHEKFALPDDDYIRLFKTMTKGAGTRKIPVSISSEQVRQLLDQSGQCCQVTGIPFNTYKPSGARMRPWVPSIDRIDATKGYELGNVRVVCACVNLALNQFGDEVFMTIANAAINFTQTNSRKNERSAQK